MLVILFRDSELFAKDFLNHEVNKSKIIIEGVLLFKGYVADDTLQQIADGLFNGRKLG